MVEDVHIVIPARYESSRFPGKPLAVIAGIPMVIRVARTCALAVGPDRVVVATENDEIYEAVVLNGFRAEMTSPDHKTGTDRVAEIADRLDLGRIVSVQGDEPLVNEADLRIVCDRMRESSPPVVNFFSKLISSETPGSPAIPKVVVSAGGSLIYISRSEVPGSKDTKGEEGAGFFKQVCIYGFTRDHLRQFAAFGRVSSTEIREDIEILRFLELGIPVEMIQTPHRYVAVDHPSDVVTVENLLRKKDFESSGSR